MPYTQEWHVVYDAFRQHPHPYDQHDDESGEGGRTDTSLCPPDQDHWSPKQARLKERFLEPSEKAKATARAKAPPPAPFTGAPVIYHAPDQLLAFRHLGCPPSWYHLDRKEVVDAHLDYTHRYYYPDHHLHPHYW